MRNENAVQFDPEAGRDHVESYFLKLNEAGGDRAVWIKATIFATAIEPSRPLAEGWAIAFDRRGGARRSVAVKHVRPLERAAFSREGLGVEWSIPPAPPPLAAASGSGSASGSASGPAPASEPESFLLRDRLTRGSIALRDHRISWDLRFQGEHLPIAPLPFEAMYSPRFPTTKLVTPYPDLRFEGEVTVDGERWVIDGWRGMQGHNWGRRHTALYAWSHTNVWEEDDTFVLEGTSASAAIGPVRTPLITLICARYRGVRYDWNTPLAITRARGEVASGAGAWRWVFSASAEHGAIEGEIEAETDDMVGLYYANPDGPMTYCLNSKLARARVRFEPRGRSPLSLTSRASALEIGTRDEGHGVRMFV
jgi:hypothetical protein